MSELNYNYIDKGSKKTIVFLHGWGLSGEVFDKCVFAMPSVSTITIDLYGFGKSYEPKDYFDTFEYSYQIFLLLKKLNIDNIIIVGHSFGGRLGIILSGFLLYDSWICKRYYARCSCIRR